MNNMEISLKAARDIFLHSIWNGLLFLQHGQHKQNCFFLTTPQFEIFISEKKKTDRFSRIAISEGTNISFRLAKKVKGLKQNPLKQGFVHCSSR